MDGELAEIAPLEQGRQIGRYVLLYRVGSGGMGVVYAAYDPELDRKVALKLIRSGLPATAARAHHLLEAKAMARLSHANVVTVYDVGDFEHQTFIAMEFVDGTTLRDWLLVHAEATWDQILAHFLQAGRGLAAAHDAGLVHQDFKAGNVLVTDDGLALVTDFGLADGVDLEARSDERHGVPGTPSYIAPERFDGAAADPRSDQFSFCVALYRALYGVAPFSEKSLPDYLDSVRSRSALEVPDRLPSGARGAATRLPPWLRKAIRTGLHADPEARFPSMEALLAAIDPRRRHRRRRRLWAAAVPIAALLAGYGISLLRHQDVCEPATDLLVGVWDEDRRGIVQRAFHAADSDRGAAVFSHAARSLDSYVDDWLRMRQESCQATVRGEQSPQLLDARIACLDERLDEVRGLSGLFSSATTLVLGRARQLTDGLTRLDRCADRVSLSARMPLPEEPGQLAEVEHWRAWMEEQRVRVRVDEPVDMEEIDRGIAALESIGYAPLLSQLLELKAAVFKLNRINPQGAMESFEKALVAAVRGRDHSQQAYIYGQLVETAALGLGDLEVANRWAPYAVASLDSLGAAYSEEQALICSALAHLAWMEGRHLDAYDWLARSVEIVEAVFGPTSLMITRPMQDLAIVASFSPQHRAEAVPLLERAISITESHYGPDHQHLVSNLGNLASIYALEGRYTQALEAVSRALAIAEGERGPDDASLAQPLLSLGKLHGALDQPEHARRAAERTRPIIAAAWGEQHPLMIHADDLEAEVLLLSDRPQEALRLFEHAGERRAALYPPEHPGQQTSPANIARAHLDLDQPAKALELLRAVEAASPPDEARDRLVFELSMGRALLGVGETEAAVSRLEKALTVERGEADGVLKAEARWHLARALVDGDAERALSEARAALEAFGEGGSPRTRRVVAELERWIETWAG